jgi:hypothetical protein
MRLLAYTALFASLGVAASAQTPDVQGPANVEPRVNQLIIYGDDPCPPSTDNEINVCARLPEADRYRIPPNLRNDPNDPRNRSWHDRAIELSYVGRTGTDSCSTVGGGGFTGCLNRVISEARAERTSGDQVNWNNLIEEARRQRAQRLNEAARQEEAENQAEAADQAAAEMAAEAAQANSSEAPPPDTPDQPE